MTPEEDNHSRATASVTTLPTLFVIVTRDTESGGADYSVSGSYGVTSGTIAESFAHDARNLNKMGLESLRQRRELTRSTQDQDQQDQQDQQRQQQQQGLTHSREDIESSFASTLPTWQARLDRVLRTTPHIDDRKAHFKSLNGTSVQVLTEEEWEAERARLSAGTLITQYTLDGTKLESTVVGPHICRDGVRKIRRRWAGWCGSCFTGERR